MSGWKRSWLIAPARSLNTGLSRIGAGGTTSSLSGSAAPVAPIPAGTSWEPNSGSRIKQIGRYLSVYLGQSLHAPHSRQVNAARARRLAR